MGREIGFTFFQKWLWVLFVFSLGRALFFDGGTEIIAVFLAVLLVSEHVDERIEELLSSRGGE